jgi:N-acetylglucosaminyldiphosphoundecaprenol N-acetyl-beta-D-mannosaminyltransferase
MEQTLDEIDRLVAAGRPSYFITANLYYAMLSDQNAELAAVNREAAFILADGMPLVWASRWRGRRLPERVAGSDLIFHVAALAARRGYRVFFLGGPPGVADEATRKLTERYPGLQVVGNDAPPDIARMTLEEEAALIARVRALRPDLLIGAFGQPKGELWIARNAEALGVPVCMQLGASIDFAAERVRRAPRWMQKTGLEWLFRTLQEPRRLAPRYLKNAAFLLRMLARDLAGGARRDRNASGP